MAITYREAIKNSLDTFTTERIEYDGGVQEPMESLPICFGWFCRSIAIILTMQIENLCKQDYPNVLIEGVETKGNRKKVVKADDILSVLFGNDMLRGTGISLSLQEFLTWLLNQEVKNESFGDMWYDYDVMIEKWNEFVTKEHGNL